MQVNRLAKGLGVTRKSSIKCKRLWSVRSCFEFCVGLLYDKSVMGGGQVFCGLQLSRSELTCLAEESGVDLLDVAGTCGVVETVRWLENRGNFCSS